MNTRRWQHFAMIVLFAILLPAVAARWGTQKPDTQTVQPDTAADCSQTTAPTEQTAAPAYYIPVVLAENTVEMMELEEYIYGVVLAEMPASFEAEALKAQAVAARTYTMRRITLSDKHTQGAVCVHSACCQAYISEAEYLAAGGIEPDAEKVKNAVYATAGEVLTYEGALIEATYFSCSGGRTEDAAAVWGTDVPYLQAVDSPGETKAAGYDADVSFTRAQLEKLLGRTLTGEPESWLGAVRYTDGGGVATMVIAGITYDGTALRTALGLASTAFTVTASADGLCFHTQGWGHRVGLSQYGADAMALAGSDYRQILLHYYQGTAIDKLRDLG